MKIGTIVTIGLVAVAGVLANHFDAFGVFMGVCAVSWAVRVRHLKPRQRKHASNLWRGLTPARVVEAGVLVTFAMSVAYLLAANFLTMNWGLYRAIIWAGQGLASDPYLGWVLRSPILQMGAAPKTPTGWSILDLRVGMTMVVLSALSVVMPRLPAWAAREERLFRYGVTRWRTMAARTTRFGWAHVWNFVPLAALASITLMGGYFAVRYKVVAEQSNSRKRALDGCSVVHAVFNMILMGALALQILAWVWLGGGVHT